MKKFNFSSDPIISAKETIKQEIIGLEAMIDFFNEDYLEAISLIIKCQSGGLGRIILSGMGKSGHIANKISATLASTGSPAFFIHPAEASHGDLGMISKNDIIILLSNSGNNKEMQDIIYYCKKFSIPIIGITRNANSELAKLSDVKLILPNIPEANLVKAPTTSTTMMLALGDAIAVSLINEKKFDDEQYRHFHPGGKLGLDLLKVKSVMRAGESIAKVNQSSKIEEVLLEITSKCLGCTAVVDDNNKLIGIITDGDLRRNIYKKIDGNEFMNQTAFAIMTPSPLTINQEMLVVEAVAIMNKNSITSLIVSDEEKNIQTNILGIINLQDCLRIGF